MVDIAHLRFKVETKDLTKATDNLKKLENEGTRAEKATNRLHGSLSNLKLIAFGVASAISAIGFGKLANDFTETASQFEQYSNRMSAFTTSLQEQNSEMLRARSFAEQYKQSIEKTTETLLLMKNYGLDASNESLKTYANTAMGAGKSINQFAEAMADALTGENERLKEFGVKASVNGQKIGYQWSDSSGKTRNIIIKNNKDIIDSTLRSIFNEKYAGQLEAYKNSWAGLWQGVKNKYTSFKLAVADAGLFSYFKSVFKVGSQSFLSMFDLGKKGAKSFSDYMISGIKSIITGVGYLIDIWNVFKVGISALKLVFGKFAEYAIRGMQAFSDASATAFNYINQKWVSFTNFLGKGWTKVINFFLSGWNKFIAGISGAWNKVATKLHLPTLTPATVSLKKFEAQTVKTIAKSKDFTKELSYWKSYSKDATSEMLSNYAKVSTRTGSNFAQQFIKNIDAVYGKVKKVDNSVAKQKADAQKALEKLGAGYGNLGKQANKTGKKIKKAHHGASKAHKDAIKRAKEHQKELKKIAEEAKKVQLQYADIFKSSFDSLLKGDFKSAFNGLFEGIGNKMLEPLKNNVSNFLSTQLSGLTSSLGAMGGGLVGMGLSMLPTLLGSLGHKLTEAEINKAKGRTDFSDDSLNKLGAVLEKANNPLLPYTKRMTEYLNSMNRNFVAIGRALSSTATFDYTGANYQAHGGSFLGWGSSYSKIGSGISLNDINLGTGAVSGYGYLTEKVHESSWFGLVEDEYVKTTKKALDSGTKNTLQEAILNGKKLILESSKLLGYDVKKQLNAVRISLGKINLDGLSSEEISKRLNNALSEVFSKSINKLGNINKLVDKYALAGEDNLATLSRIAVTYEQSSDLLKNIGFKLEDTVTRSKPLFGGFFGSMNGVIEQFGWTSKKVYTVQQKVLDIVKFSGGQEKFNSNYNSFFNNYYNDAEKLSIYKRTLAKQFDSLGIAMPKNKEALKHLIEGYNVTTEAQAKTYAELLKLQEAFSSTADLADKVKNAELDRNKALLNSAIEYKNKITDLYLGQYSPLKMAQKELLAMRAVNNTTGADWEASSKRALELKYNNATSTQDYRSAFNSYLQALNTNAPKATMDDVVEKLDKHTELMQEQQKTQDKELKEAQKQIDELQKIVTALNNTNNLKRVSNE